MGSRRIGVIVLALAVCVVVVPGAVRAASVKSTSVYGTVGPGYTITLKSAAGKLVKTLPAGLVTFHISDRSSNHDFHLTGPGVNRSTEVPARGNYVWRVVLKKGTYKYMCDPHQLIMHGQFRVS